MSESVNERAQRLGSLIEAARLHAGRTTADCAQQLALSSSEYTAVEAGTRPVSMPELELLALFLGVPMAYFWGTAVLNPSHIRDAERYIALRQRMIAVLLRQRRMERGLSVDALAEAAGIGVEQIEAYEGGSTAVGYVDLERISQALGLPVVEFVDDQVGPLGRHEAEQQLIATFQTLPPETQAFLLNPRNSSFLDIARRLSEMDVDRLRQIAEGILDITY